MSTSDLPNESSGECWPTARGTEPSSPTAAPTAVAGILAAIAQSLDPYLDRDGEGHPLPPEAILELRFECEAEMARLGLTWKHERVRAFFARCNPSRPTLDGQNAATLEALLEKLRAIKA